MWQNNILSYSTTLEISDETTGWNILAWIFGLVFWHATLSCGWVVAKINFPLLIMEQVKLQSSMNSNILFSEKSFFILWNIHVEISLYWWKTICSLITRPWFLNSCKDLVDLKFDSYHSKDYRPSCPVGHTQRA